MNRLNGNDGELSRFTGRVIKKFVHKKVMMILLSEEGTEKRGIVKDDSTLGFEKLKKQVSIGDYIRIQGMLQLGKDGQEEIKVTDLTFLCKTKLNASETGLLEDGGFKGTKLKRYYHTLMLTDPLCTLSIKTKSIVLSTLHQELEKRGYYSVSTPVLQHDFFAGGARPFVTHMVDSDTDMYLRITSEIALKLLVAGGLNRIYEIGNYFRNGSVNEMHAVPFQAVEIYQTDVDEKQVKELANELLVKMTCAVKPLLREYSFSPKVNFYEKTREIDFETFVHKVGYPKFRLDDYTTYPDVQELQGVNGNLFNDSKALYKWFKKKLIKNQIQPLWITDLPAGQSPLIEKKSKHVLRRSYLVANGITLAEVAQSEIDSDILEENLNRQNIDCKNEYPRDYSALLHAFKLGVRPITSLFISLDRIIPMIVGVDNINKYKMYI